MVRRTIRSPKHSDHTEKDEFGCHCPYPPGVVLSGIRAEVDASSGGTGGIPTVGYTCPTWTIDASAGVEEATVPCATLERHNISYHSH